MGDQITLPLSDPPERPVPDWIPEDLHKVYRNLCSVWGVTKADAHMRGRVEERARKQELTVQRDAEILALPRSTRRRRLIADAIGEQQPSEDDKRFIHSTLALCGLPYKTPPAGTDRYERRYGNAVLRVIAGDLEMPGGSTVRPGIPYGPKARLLLMHFCSLALRNDSPTIEISPSMSALIRDLGFEVTGGARGSIAAFKEQLNRLAACHFELGWSDGTSARNKKLNPIEDFDVFLSSDPNQPSLWTETVQLGDRFFSDLKKHALPIDIRLVRGLTESARKLDILFWLSWRVPKIGGDLYLSWDNLREQFGAGIADASKFRQAMREDFHAVADVLPKLRYKLSETGLVVSPGSLIIPKRRLITSKRA